MHECCIWPIFQYRAETWTLKKTEMERITSFELWWYRRILKISWEGKKTNELKKVNQQPKLLKLAMKQKMAYMGHLIRKNDNIL